MDRAGEEVGQALRACRSPVARIRPRAPSSAPALEFEAEQAVLLDRGRAGAARRSCRPRSRSGRNTAHRRPAGRRRGRGARASRSARCISLRADAAVAASAATASGPSSSAGRPGPARHVPQPHGADDAAVLDRRERQPFGRQAAFAQRAPRLGEARRPEGRVEQALARRDVGRAFLADRSIMANSFQPSRKGFVSRTEGEPGSRLTRRLPVGGQMWTVFSGGKPLKATDE